jgi:hypothetical protein
MRISEKTLELTLCSQFSWIHTRWTMPFLFHGLGQPLWFGLTQKQEAQAGFDAATRLNSGRILIFQFKAGKRLKGGGIRFVAPHSQLIALQARVNAQKRLIYYVLPEVTQTHELNSSSPWVLATTWLLDVGDIPTLGAPSRKSQNHNLTLDPRSGIVEITSDPVEVQTTNATDFVEKYGWSSLGAKYDGFDNFWKYAKLLGKGAVAAALSEKR